jgi:MFS family permease
VLAFLWVTVAGRLSDQIGRKTMYLIGCACMGVFGFIYFALLDHGSSTVIFIAVAVSWIPVMTLYGPEAALIAEAFSPRLRYSGASLGYQLASIIAGGPAPFIATALFAAYHSSLPIAFYILGCSVVGAIATALLADYTGKEISGEYEGVNNQDIYEVAQVGANAHFLPERMLMAGKNRPRCRRSCAQRVLRSMNSGQRR